MQIKLPIADVSQPAESTAPSPRLEKPEAAHSFDHYLGTGEASKTPPSTAKSAADSKAAKPPKGVEKPTKSEKPQDPGLPTSWPTLNQAMPAPLPTSLTPGDPVGEIEVSDPGEAATATVETTPALAAVLPTGAAVAPLPGTSPEGSAQPRLSNNPTSFPPSPAGKHASNVAPLDLPLPTAGESKTAVSSPSLFPSPETSASPLVLADPATLQPEPPTADPVALVQAAALEAAAATSPVALANSAPAGSPGRQHRTPAADDSAEGTSELPPLQLSSSASMQLPSSGTRAAMERSTMSDALLSRQAKAKAAGFTSIEKSPLLSATAKSASPAPATGNTVRAAATTSAEPSEDTSSNSLAPIDATLTVPAQPNSSAEASATPKVATLSPDAAVTLDHVREMTEHLHTTGHRSMEMEVQLEGEQRLTISLHLERGELKTVFKTDSTALRDALAQNWGQVAEKGDRSLRFNPPVFQSPSSQGGFLHDPRQQGRQERPFDQAEGQRFARLSPAPVPPAAVSRPEVTATPTGLELYA